MKKKRKFNPKKFIKTWSIIIVVIIIIMMVISINKKGNKVVQEKNKEVASTDIVENNTIIVPITEPEIDSKTTDWNLILVNKDNPIPQNYQYELATVEGNHKVDIRIADVLKQMLGDARKEGLKPLICSSHRTTDIQTTLFNQKVNQHIRLGYKQRRSRRKSILLGNKSTNQ